ncbi:hypothetical protein ASD64_08955 [Mesorhizobium sp. Root157]|uniref:hypothetical protein n=1 Tax=Mesorhizobium sp. Root157 TaxID=1736477 RepID=UPI0006F4D94E|nr:hypothetical protein [Mesorhizobium sp. Root157]KQZ81877.1 hypothetical protein ASD64_08955 [Mesorhizobium sp. Root157]
MVKERGGFVTVHLTVRIAWWVAPYTLAVKAFLWSVAPFFDEDDDRLDTFITRQAEFVSNHGVRFYCNGKRV